MIDPERQISVNGKESNERTSQRWIDRLKCHADVFLSFGNLVARAWEERLTEPAIHIIKSAC